jgi:hypothetical protein
MVLSSVFMYDGRQSLISLRNGLCSSVTRVGGKEIMVTR